MPSRSPSTQDAPNKPGTRVAAAPRDTSIETYRAKRDFTVTAEPAPRYPKPGKDAPMFVVQKHRAHRAGLHWDFRLEHGGVLWSWAVRKGPSLDPKDKRIAAHVEDHPIDYADFQGTIPDGQYGAGTVETWDRGTWQALGDPEAGMRDGEIKFVLAGHRLNGKFTLVRLRPKPNERRRSQDNWLLIKGHDESERAGVDAEALEGEIPPPPPRTARSGDDEPAAQQTEGSSNSDAASPAGNSDPAPSRNARSGDDKPLRAGGAPAQGAKRRGLPERQTPQLAELVRSTPAGEDWLTEIKFDGYRLLIFIENGKVRVITRNGHDWTDRLPAVAQAASALPIETALLDGELVALDGNGVSSFPMLQAALSAGRDQTLNLFVFDLLHLNGWDLRSCPLIERKRVLAGLDLGHGMFHYSDHHQGNPANMQQNACAMKLEGVICKRQDEPYQGGRGHGWLKLKCQGREEFIVLGWTPPGGSRTGFGALHVGYYDAEHRLHYAGGVGTGFSDEVLALLADRLGQIASDPPRDLMFAGDPLDPTIRWVRPELVVEVQFVNWSGAGRVRHAVYLGLREDKSADEVVTDVANPEVEREPITPKPPKDDARGRRGPIVAVPPKRVARSVGKAGLGAAADAAAPERFAANAHEPPTGEAPSERLTASTPVGKARKGSRPTPGAELALPLADPEPGEEQAPSRKNASRALRSMAEDQVPASPARVVTARRAAPKKAAAATSGDASATRADPAATPADRAAKRGSVVIARAPKARNAVVEGVTITHPDRELWPGITKQHLAEYWVAIADHALPGLAHRPLALVRCPEGIGGEHFFQKHANATMPGGIHEGSADKAPFLAIDGLHGLVGMAQISAIELHAWGAAEADPLKPDQIVLDLDPGEGVTFPEVVEATHEVRKRVEALGLAAFCRTSGGKGLHVVVPLTPEAGWDTVKPFCRAFAEMMGLEAPEKYLSTIKIADRRGRILVDWLRNGLGATAVASFCPRARAGAGVATPLAWDEVTRKLDPGTFSLTTIPKRLAHLAADPWGDFEISRRPLPRVPHSPTSGSQNGGKAAGKARIVEAKAPRKR